MLKEDFEVFVQTRIEDIMKPLDVLIAGTSISGVSDDTKNYFFKSVKTECVATYQRGFFDAVKMLSTHEQA